MNSRKIPARYSFSTVFYRKALHWHRMTNLLDLVAFFTKNVKSLQRNFRFQKQNSGICFISSGNVLLTGTNLSELFFRLRKCRKYPKKTVFFSQNLDFAWYFMVFLVRTSYTAADTLTAGQVGPRRGLSSRVPKIDKNPKKCEKSGTLKIGPLFLSSLEPKRIALWSPSE